MTNIKRGKWTVVSGASPTETVISLPRGKFQVYDKKFIGGGTVIVRDGKIVGGTAIPEPEPDSQPVSGETD